MKRILTTLAVLICAVATTDASAAGRYCDSTDEAQTCFFSFGDRFRVAHTQNVMFDEITPVTSRALGEVRQLREIGQDVIGVVAQQRIAVEDQCRDAGDDHHVEAHCAHRARLDREPQVERKRRDEELDEHTGGADDRARPP